MSYSSVHPARCRIITLGIATAFATACVLSASPIRAEALQVPAGGVFLLQNAATKKCLDVPGVEQANSDGPTNQQSCRYTPTYDNMGWVLKRERLNHPKGYGRFVIRHEYDSTCLDLPGFGAVKKTTRVTTYRCAKNSSKDNQVFYAKKTKRGWMFVHDKSKNLCLDVAGFSSKADGEPITLYTCDPKGDHDWVLRKPKPSAENQSVRGAFSQSFYTMNQNDYKFRAYVSDTIRDRKSCAYVEFELWYATGISDLANIYLKGEETMPRRTVCDRATSKAVTVDPDKLIGLDRIIATKTKVKVRTCENINNARDRCTEYSTPPNDF